MLLLSKNSWARSGRISVEIILNMLKYRDAVQNKNALTQLIKKKHI